MQKQKISFFFAHNTLKTDAYSLQHRKLLQAPHSTPQLKSNDEKNSEGDYFELKHRDKVIRRIVLSKDENEYFEKWDPSFKKEDTSVNLKDTDGHIIAMTPAKKTEHHDTLSYVITPGASASMDQTLDIMSSLPNTTCLPLIKVGPNTIEKLKSDDCTVFIPVPKEIGF